MTNTDGSKHVAKLGNDNYYSWSYRMEICLRKLQVWSIVEGSESRPLGSDASKAVKAWRIRMDLALSEIVGEVEDGQLVHTRVSRDPSDVWARLQDIHVSQGLGSAISTWQKLFQMRKAPAASIQEHVGMIRELADRLTGLGDPPSDSLLVAVLMLSLPDSYSSLVISLDSHSSKNDFDFVVQRCMNEEARQVAKQGVPAKDDPNNAAFHANVRPRRDRKDITCFQCQQKGHYKNECTQTQNGSQKTVETAGMAVVSSEDSEVFW
ncbi:hypothetical protein CVT25_002763 [Psilocybe cyanescens]|uniref:CCHC-type domain-containing protein n=1 Tax=Psilocybe cyanescens TaxID=93625 RepID=A0A409X5W9_PSICY|nr:hypothetical protein CVT25_002763 [Psilocybe cyanescens]